MCCVFDYACYGGGGVWYGRPPAAAVGPSSCHPPSHSHHRQPQTPTPKQKKQQGIKKAIPLGRLGKASEIAGMVRFLAVDPAAAYITG